MGIAPMHMHAMPTQRASSCPHRPAARMQIWTRTAAVPEEKLSAGLMVSSSLVLTPQAEAAVCMALVVAAATQAASTAAGAMATRHAPSASSSRRRRAIATQAAGILGGGRGREDGPCGARALWSCGVVCGRAALLPGLRSRRSPQEPRAREQQEGEVWRRMRERERVQATRDARQQTPLLVVGGCLGSRKTPAPATHVCRTPRPVQARPTTPPRAPPASAVPARPCVHSWQPAATLPK